MGMLAISGIGDLQSAHNGLIDQMFKNALQQTLADLHDRPALKKPRKIVVQVDLQPRVGDDGLIADVLVGYAVQAKLPPMATGDFSAALQGTKAFAVNELSPRNVNQGTLPLEGEKE